MKEFRNGLLTGLTLQLAIGPVFFFIINLALQKTFFDGFAGVLGVTLADYIYIFLALFGIGKILEHQKYKKIFGIVGSIVLILFGGFIIRGIIGGASINNAVSNTASILTSFSSVFFLTISSPLTIVLFTSVFAAKALELKLTKKGLLLFGLGTGFATFLFMGSSMIIFSLIKETISLLLVQILNGIVGSLLIGYGGLRLWKINEERAK